MRFTFGQLCSQIAHFGFRLREFGLQTLDVLYKPGIANFNLFNTCVEFLNLASTLLNCVAKCSQFTAHFSCSIRGFVALHCVEQTLFIALALEVFFFDCKGIALTDGNVESTLNFCEFFTHLGRI